ncbi:MAG TPA: hypothetical protein ENG80_04435 [Nitrospirae bacterium]|nr:hypothetical protein [Nitrospirota bacterium]
MILAVFFLFSLLLLFYILSPIFGERYWPFMRGGVFEQLYGERKTGIWAISDVDAEYEMGKLTEEDHSLLREQFKAEVAPVLLREKELTINSGLSPEKGLSGELREEMIKEVIRICGKEL